MEISWSYLSEPQFKGYPEGPSVCSDSNVGSYTVASSPLNNLQLHLVKGSLTWESEAENQKDQEETCHGVCLKEVISSFQPHSISSGNEQGWKTK